MPYTGRVIRETGWFPLYQQGTCWYNTSMVLRRTRHSVYDTGYHLVWCPKYRKDLFARNDVKERAGELFHEIAQEYEYDIQEMAVCKDHVHLLISFPPRYSISQVVKTLKSISARELFKEYPRLKKRLWKGEMWEDGYFARTVGDKLTKDVIDKYIKSQEDIGKIPGQLDLELQ